MMEHINSIQLLDSEEIRRRLEEIRFEIRRASFTMVEVSLAAQEAQGWARIARNRNIAFKEQKRKVDDGFDDGMF